MRSISLSLMAGTMGATITLTGTPAALSARIASSRRGGVAARGSILRATVRSSVVTEMATLTSPRPAMRARMSDVPHHQRRLGDDADRMARRIQHLQDRSGDAMLALDRLIGVGNGAERDHLGRIARVGQLALQQPPPR